MKGLAFPAASSVRKAVNTGSVTSRSTILVMKISPNFLSSLIIVSVLFCTGSNSLSPVLYVSERAKKVKVATGQD